MCGAESCLFLPVVLKNSTACRCFLSPPANLHLETLWRLIIIISPFVPFFFFFFFCWRLTRLFHQLLTLIHENARYLSRSIMPVRTTCRGAEFPSTHLSAMLNSLPYRYSVSSGLVDGCLKECRHSESAPTRANETSEADCQLRPLLETKQTCLLVCVHPCNQGVSVIGV